MKRWVIIVAAVAVAGAATAYFATRSSGTALSYRFVTVDRGSVDSVVSATGTLSAVTTVQVGTQVSGLIAKLNVDFNDKVEKGQVIARLDTTLLESNLRDVEASLERSRAELKQAERDLERITSLYNEGISAVADFNKAQYNYDVAKASVKSAEASLARARQNLAYATITAPVSGIVVERAVDVGQTVAASMSTPRLFTIANDLSEMQILAPVDESDIGQIKEGQSARFTVKTYPDRKFTGTVKQVRLQSTVEQNVVNYTVVISAKNPDGKLLPGMTATVEFLVATAADVLRVPNAALRFKPSDAVVAKVRQRLQQERAARMASTGEGAGTDAGTAAGRTPAADSRTGSAREGGRSGAPGGAGGQGPQSMSLLYGIDDKGEIVGIPVRPGITDGQYTEVRGRSLEEGMQVIAGMALATAKAAANPFQATQQQGRPPGPPGSF